MGSTAYVKATIRTQTQQQPVMHRKLHRLRIHNGQTFCANDSPADAAQTGHNKPMASLMLPIAKSLITARAEASRHRKTLQQPTPICHTKSGPQNRGQFCFTKRAGKSEGQQSAFTFSGLFFTPENGTKNRTMFWAPNAKKQHRPWQQQYKALPPKMIRMDIFQGQR